MLYVLTPIDRFHEYLSKMHGFRVEDVMSRLILLVDYVKLDFAEAFEHVARHFEGISYIHYGKEGMRSYELFFELDGVCECFARVCDAEGVLIKWKWPYPRRVRTSDGRFRLQDEMDKPFVVAFNRKIERLWLLIKIGQYYHYHEGKLRVRKEHIPESIDGVPNPLAGINIAIGHHKVIYIEVVRYITQAINYTSGLDEEFKIATGALLALLLEDHVDEEYLFGVPWNVLDEYSGIKEPVFLNS